MAEFCLSEVLAATGGSLTGPEYQKAFAGVSTDTRSLKPGNLFVALRGENFDGHDFIIRAVDGGATGVVVSNREVFVPERTTTVVVNNTLTALQDLAGFHRQRFSIPVVAITGSNGKTTTKDMTAATLANRFAVLKTEANYNNEIGLPFTLFNMTREHQVTVVEMGMRAPGEIRRLAEIAAPTLAVITNVGETHIELLGSLDNIAAAKGELVEAIPSNGLVVLNADDSRVCAMQDQTAAQVMRFGLGPRADVRAENPAFDNLKTTFDCLSPQGRFPVTLPAIGRHNVYNALAAISVGLALGLEPDEINAGLASFLPSAMRLHIQTVNGFTIINDTYNASPLSMAAALQTLSEVSKGRKVAVLGDMLELGQVAVEAHRRIGESLANHGVQVVITVGELSRHIAAAALENGVDVTVSCQTHAEAQEALRKLMRRGDTVLVKGSRGMKMEKILTMFQ